MLPLILTPMYWSNEWQFYLQCSVELYMYVLEHHELARIKFKEKYLDFLIDWSTEVREIVKTFYRKAQM